MEQTKSVPALVLGVSVYDEAREATAVFAVNF